jgi:hypothetical protein
VQTYEEKLAANRRYYARNRETRLAYLKKYREEHPAQMREYNANRCTTKKRNDRLKRYGLDSKSWDALFEEQGRACAVCAKSDGEWHVDHDHESGKVRAILCSSCNRGLGFFFDNPTLLRIAATYLEDSK